MREAVREEIEAAADAMDQELTQALTLKADPSEGLPEAYDVTTAKIAELKAAYMPLTIAGVVDKAGYLQVHEARMEVKALRIAVEKKRLDLNGDSQKYIKAVNAYAKKITADLEPIEAHQEGRTVNPIAWYTLFLTSVAVWAAPGLLALFRPSAIKGGPVPSPLAAPAIRHLSLSDRLRRRAEKNAR